MASIHINAQLLPALYKNSLIKPNSSVYPGLADDSHPIVFELGREANAGPPLLNFLSFQYVYWHQFESPLTKTGRSREAKIQVPFVGRIESSPNTPFLYKRQIMVDSALDVAGSWISFGLNTSLNTFIPSNSSNSSSFDYEVTGVIKASLKSVENGVVPIETFQSAAGLPWFAEFATCAQHFYNFTGAIQRLSGKVVA
jgi:hypothetical protein